MYEKLINSLIAAFVACVVSVGMIWFLQDQPQDYPIVQDNRAGSAGSASNLGHIEAESIKVHQSITIVDSKGDPLIELKNGNLYVRNDICTSRIGSEEIMSKKIQITPGDPNAKDAPVFCEMSTQKEDGGAYFALLSPRGSHSVNIGFDKNETGFIISQNNKDDSLVAQAILPIPSADKTQKSLLSRTPESKFPPASAPMTGKGPAVSSWLPNSGQNPVRNNPPLPADQAGFAQSRTAGPFPENSIPQGSLAPSTALTPSSSPMRY
ncbi:MAG: hypothetical protein Q4G69_11015 [Planctomycetia bacterium]|nr:hypothetical protein [Planctomycetia bacterium]